jgi:hypothetical protein
MLAFTMIGFDEKFESHRFGRWYENYFFVNPAKLILIVKYRIIYILFSQFSQ